MEKRQRIVIIDDNAKRPAGHARYLERFGRRHSRAPVRKDCASPSRLLPDAMVIDCMPGMNGSRSRGGSKTIRSCTIPVLMLTGSDSAGTSSELGAGADDFVTKGADIESRRAPPLLLRMKAYQDQLRRMRPADDARPPDRATRARHSSANGLRRQRHRDPLRAASRAGVLSGDFYDYFVQDGSMYIFVADVSGHSLPAAILVSLLKSYITAKPRPSRRSRIHDPPQ
jgi:DNA-binding response OmpR family regulator